MIKSIFLKFKSKPFLSGKPHATYLASRNIGILYNAMEFDTAMIGELEERLRAEDKHLSTIGFSEEKTEEELLFCKKDISTTGSISKNNLALFVDQPFDFLISLDTSANIHFKYVLALSKAICKIGLDVEQYTDLLQMSIKMDNSNPNAVKDIIRYLKMI